MTLLELYSYTRFAKPILISAIEFIYITTTNTGKKADLSLMHIAGSLDKKLVTYVRERYDIT